MNDQPYLQQTPDWFNNPAPAPSPRPSRRGLKIIMFVIAIVVALAAIPTVTYFSRPACLTPQAYKELTGVNYTETLRPTDNFYTTALTFMPNAGTLDDTSSALMQDIANFYKKYQSSSIHIVIDSSFTNSSDRALTLVRAESLQSIALKNGIAQKVLHVEQPSSVEAEDESASVAPSHTLSITSMEGCR